MLIYTNNIAHNNTNIPISVIYENIRKNEKLFMTDNLSPCSNNSIIRTYLKPVYKISVGVKSKQFLPNAPSS